MYIIKYLQYHTPTTMSVSSRAEPFCAVTSANQSIDIYSVKLPSTQKHLEVHLAFHSFTERNISMAVPTSEGRIHFYEGRITSHLCTQLGSHSLLPELVMLELLFSELTPQAGQVKLFKVA